MTLSKIITKLTKQNSDGKKLFTQDTLAVRLGLDPRKGQQQLSKMKSGGEVWELHWRMFLRLLPVCIEHEILSPHDLKELWGNRTQARGAKISRATTQIILKNFKIFICESQGEQRGRGCEI